MSESIRVQGWLEDQKKWFTIGHYKSEVNARSVPNAYNFSKYRMDKIVKTIQEIPLLEYKNGKWEATKNEKKDCMQMV